MFYGNKDNFHFRPIRPSDEKIVRNLIFDILRDYGLELDVEGVDHDLFNITDYYKDHLFGVIENIETHEIIGSFALYKISDSEMELRKMYLLKRYRRKGIGKWIIDFCEAYAKKNGFTEISLETASVLSEAIMLYQKMGYIRDLKKNHTTRCDWVMRKKI